LLVHQRLRGHSVVQHGADERRDRDGAHGRRELSIIEGIILARAALEWIALEWIALELIVSGKRELIRSGTCDAAHEVAGALIERGRIANLHADDVLRWAPDTSRVVEENVVHTYETRGCHRHSSGTEIRADLAC
jgi:hypothetical protein